jgi:hypothetical protein
MKTGRPTETGAAKFAGGKRWLPPAIPALAGPARESIAAAMPAAARKAG